MLIQKTIQTSVDLFDTSDIYAANKVDLLISKLTDRFVGRCYQAMLVTKIVRIIKYSDTKIVDDRLDASAFIDVQFMLEGIVLLKGEILHGCKVVDISTSGILFESKYAEGLIQAMPDRAMQVNNVNPTKAIMKIIKKDQIIPVIVVSVSYNPNQSKISVMAMPFIPVIYPTCIYNITNLMSPEDTEKAEKLLTMFSDEIALHAETSKSYEFFKELLYPFKTNQKFELTPVGGKFALIKPTLETLLKIKNGCIVAPIEAYKSYGLCIYKSDLANDFTVSATLYSALTDIISKRTMYLQGLRGFAEQYDTLEKIQELVTYWKVFSSFKQ